MLGPPLPACSPPMPARSPPPTAPLIDLQGKAMPLAKSLGRDHTAEWVDQSCNSRPYEQQPHSPEVALDPSPPGMPQLSRRNPPRSPTHDVSSYAARPPRYPSCKPDVHAHAGSGPGSVLPHSSGAPRPVPPPPTLHKQAAFHASSH
ncbi:MAG: hypothetical protein WDW36_000419 [Sanguina aurantia]